MGHLFDARPCRGIRAGVTGLLLRTALAATAGLVPSAALSGQYVGGIDVTHYRTVLPDAERFGEVMGVPPVVPAYRVTESGADTLVGYVFLTSDYPPEQIGYNGPIEALVGMRPDGTITGVRVIDYDESYMRQMGDFLRRPGFQQQFSGKYIGDPFRVWGDVDGISRVTISVRALARGVRDSARQVAAAYGSLGGARVADDEDAEIVGLTWFQLNQAGIVSRLDITDPGEGSAGISVAYIPSDAVGTYLLGRPLYERAVREMRARGDVEHLLLYAVEGPRLRLFVREGWSLEQGGDTTAIEPEDVFSLALLPEDGLVSEEASMVGVFMIDRELDLREPFRFLYDLGSRLGVHTLEVTAQGVGTEAVAEAAGPVEPQRAVAEPADAELPEPAPAERPPVAEASEAEPTQASSEEPTEMEPATDSAAPPRTEGEGRSTETGAAAASEVSTGGVPDEAVGPDSGASAPIPATASEATRADTDPPDPLQSLEFSVTSDESLLALTLSETAWDRVVRMLLVLALALWAFFSKGRWVRWAALGATVGVLGFMDGSFLSVSHITSGIWAGPSVYLRDLPLLLMVVFTVATTLVWGRVFCGFTCPFGALQDALERVVPRRVRRRLPQRLHDRAIWVKYGLLAVIVLPAIVGSHISLYQYFEPFGTVFFVSPSPFFWSIAAGFLVASAVVPRFYCRYACPLGAGLALLSVVSLRRIGRVEQCDPCKVCEQSCPTGAIRGPTIDFKECVRCNECEVLLRERRGVCRHDMDEIRPRLVQLRVGTSSTASLPAPPVASRGEFPGG